MRVRSTAIRTALLTAVLAAPVGVAGSAGGEAVPPAGQPVTTGRGPMPAPTPSASGTGDVTTEGITVTGDGTVSAAPDQLRFTVGVQVEGDTVSAARDAAATSTQAVLAALRDAGVAAQDVQTAQFIIEPQYRYPDDGPRALTGYLVRNTVRVTVRELSTSATVIDAAVVAGGNNTVLSGVSFVLADDDTQLRAAREAAWRDAMAKAEQLAALAGGELGAVQAIWETTSTTPPAPFPVDRTAADLTIPIEPGEVISSVSLTVRFQLAGAASPSA